MESTYRVASIYCVSERFIFVKLKFQSDISFIWIILNVQVYNSHVIHDLTDIKCFIWQASTLTFHYHADMTSKGLGSAKVEVLPIFQLYRDGQCYWCPWWSKLLINNNITAISWRQLYWWRKSLINNNITAKTIKPT
jgi:hypothetical protein